VEIRERSKWDIRESMVGTETFQPKHIIIATWKNVSFAGGITVARRIVSILYPNLSKSHKIIFRDEVKIIIILCSIDVSDVDVDL